MVFSTSPSWYGTDGNKQSLPQTHPTDSTMVYGIKGDSGGQLSYSPITNKDVGLDKVANERQYSASNQPPYPVLSVNSYEGDVVLTKEDIELENVDNVRQYSASNPPPLYVHSIALTAPSTLSWGGVIYFNVLSNTATSYTSINQIYMGIGSRNFVLCTASQLYNNQLITWIYASTIAETLYAYGVDGAIISLTSDWKITDSVKQVI